MVAHRVGQAQKQGHDDPVRDEGGPAGSKEGCGQTGERNHPGDAADHDEALQGDHKGETDAEQLAEVVIAGEADAEAAGDEEQVQREDRENPGQAEFLAEAGDDVVTLRDRSDLRTALSEAGADEPALGEAEEALDQLVAASVGAVDIRVERVQPVLEPAVDVFEGLARDEGSAKEERHTQQHPAEAAGGEVEHDQEQTEVEQGGAEVTLEDDDGHGQRPDHEDRTEVPQARKAHPEEFLAHHGEAVAVAHEVAGEEDREGDLRDLAWLEGGEGPDADPHARTADLAAEAGHERQQEQGHTDKTGDVGVAEQDPVVADDQDDRDRTSNGQGAPDGLAHGSAGPAGLFIGQVDAIDHGDAEAIEQCGDGQDERVSLAGHDAQNHVHCQHQHRQSGAQQHQGCVDPADCAELHENDGAGVDPARDQQQEQLEVAQLLRQVQAADAGRARERIRRRGPVTGRWHFGAVRR